MRIAEIFYSIQGESSHAGRRCVFVRLSGCDLRCDWCDTAYAFKGGAWTSLESILEQVGSYGCRLVEITGGEPLLQAAVHPLMTTLCDSGYEVLLETSGSRPIDGVDPRVAKIVDVKCPGSGEASRNHWPNMKYLGSRDEVKFVVADRTDYEFAAETIREWALDARGQVLPLIAPVHGRMALETLAAWILSDRLEVRFQLQLHKQVWGPEATGV